MPKTKQQKRDEAYARAQARDDRTPSEQLRLIAERPGGSERELARLKGDKT